ncbi:MAG: ABC transporter ATP-binding protein [Acidobacteria bacterium]|nr:MAG: ABC transporter ATP-binding protein [Acidobacteriota bacterium]
MKPIIHVENLSKRYTIGAKAEPYSTLRESLVSAVRKPIDRMRRNGPKAADSQFWALSDVSFDVTPGEVVGIIGRNGAGKSTLLKILSRITEPTNGKVELYGRVGSLLEVGTGFHPELTGRENIFLNGAILGMHREEIAKKFDEIVDFAEIEEFLDTPVKRYSSGMYMRLAFAVAANLEPEVLIVDEVLAVGDAEFQKKCLGKMRDVSQHGRTVLFVSHNIKAIQQLCDVCILLESGKLIAQGATPGVVQQYVRQQPTDQEQRSPSKVRILDIRIMDDNGAETNLISFDRALVVEVNCVVSETLLKPAVDIAFYRGETRLFALQSDKLLMPSNVTPGNWTVTFEIQPTQLVAEELCMDVGIREEGEGYSVLIEDAKKIMPDYSTVPAEALVDCLIYPRASCSAKMEATVNV